MKRIAQPSIIFMIFLISSLLNNASSAGEKNLIPASTSYGGLSVSVSANFTEGRQQVSDFLYDRNFKHSTSGLVGRNGRVGNVSAIKVTGLNVPPQGGTGTVTVNEYIKNDINHAEVNQPEDDDSLDLFENVAGVNSSMDGKNLAIKPYQAKFSSMGMWQNTKKNGNTLFFSAGMFVDGQASNPNKHPNHKGLGDIYHGMLAGINGPECNSSDCQWGIEAIVSANIGIDKTLSISTSKTIRVDEDFDAHHKTITPRPDLNITGTLTYDQQSNTFKGNIKNAGGTTGTAVGRYYGPNYDEFAIVYNVGSAGQASAQMGVMYGGLNPKQQK